MASPKTPDASEVENGKSLSIIFWDSWKCLGYNLPDASFQGKTFHFELFSNSHVTTTNVRKYSIILTSIVTESREELDPIEFAKKNNWLHEKVLYPNGSGSQTVFNENTVAKALFFTDPTEVQGVRVKFRQNQAEGSSDKFFTHCIFPSPQFLALSELSNTANDPNNVSKLIILIVNKIQPKFLSEGFSQVKNMFERLNAFYCEFCKKAQELFDSAKEKNGNDFAKFAKGNKEFSNTLFGMKGKNIEKVEDYLVDLPPKVLRVIFKQ